MKRQENGNVLFIILIAVALFAALNYAMSQTSRSGTDSGSNERNLIDSSQINHYPALINTTLLRMMMNKVDDTEFEFNPPSDFNDLTRPQVGVFHTNGGGAAFQMAAANLMANDQPGMWHFNGNFEIENLTQSIPNSFDGNEIIAFLPGIKKQLCERINEELSISGVPNATNADYYNNAIEDMDSNYTPPSSETIIGPAGSASLAPLDHQPFGCYHQTSSDSYIYYHVILER